MLWKHRGTHLLMVYYASMEVIQGAAAYNCEVETLHYLNEIK